MLTHGPSEHTKCVTRSTPVAIFVYISLFCAVGLDFRDHAPADPGRYCDPLLQPVDGEVSVLMVVAGTFP
jgi:hypothetical protein